MWVLIDGASRISLMEFIEVSKLIVSDLVGGGDIRGWHTPPRLTILPFPAAILI